MAGLNCDEISFLFESWESVKSLLLNSSCETNKLKNSNILAGELRRFHFRNQNYT